MESASATKTQYGKYDLTNTAGTLRSCGGDVGGGQRNIGHLLYHDTIGALCSADYKWVQQQQVMQGKLIVEIWK